MPSINFIKPYVLWSDRVFIPDQFKPSEIDLRKARVLVFIHQFIFLFGITFHIANTIFEAAGPSLVYGILVNFLFMYIFKRYGNFNVSGNLLALLLFFFMGEAVFETGGLYSDNLLYILTTPLLALLFANHRSGLFWLMSLVVFTGYLYYLEINATVSYREQTFVFDANYFLTTYIGLFVIVTGIVLIFATGQSRIVRILNLKQKELTTQKAELIQQTESLQKAEKQLLESNRELEQFAYAASHDLKEPLRMIGMYTQLIKKKIGKDTDAVTNEYMHFVSDGVTRMERLLHDLLEYSRLGKSIDRTKSTDLNEVLFIVINNLTVTMRDTDAEILSNNLPVLPAASTEMVQLFQNLIANSIKFRRKEANPVISIDHEIQNGKHRFKLTDNGIGISEDYREKVFNIFERVHGRKDYEGTGIGLATCKKIVSNMGGDIWVEPSEAPGTTFVFTFPSVRSN